MIVVDASVAIAALLSNGAARELLKAERLAAPHLIDSEIANALRGMVRAGTIGGDDGFTALAAWSALGIQRHPTVGLFKRIWALRENCSAYDATYIALAEALDCPLATADARLARAPGVRCPVHVMPW